MYYVKRMVVVGLKVECVWIELMSLKVVQKYYERKIDEN